MNYSVPEASIEKITASGRIRTVAATYGCKILQLCEYDENVYGYELRMTSKQYHFMQHKGQLITEMTSFCIVQTVHV